MFRTLEKGRNGGDDWFNDSMQPTNTSRLVADIHFDVPAGGACHGRPNDGPGTARKPPTPGPAPPPPAESNFLSVIFYSIFCKSFYRSK